ncbi:MAG: DUF484 family protein [Candidatus Accumulibacter sp.]|jgi:uncharacterized protein YigA (DUF484 family)|nr:DUF484 family protein [Accumulibacter sp.]
MKSQDVADFLLGNPQFFEEHSDLVLQLEIPHPHSGRTISITERQMLALRERNRYLEGKLGEWLQFGKENDSIGEKLHRLGVALIAASTFQAVMHILNFHLRDDFDIPHIALRLWNYPDNAEDLPEFAKVGEELRAFAETLLQPYCGTTAGFETSSWFGDIAGHVRSQALISLRKGGGSIGLVALGSDDERRYHSEMGTLYLERLGEMASAAFARILRQA